MEEDDNGSELSSSVVDDAIIVTMPGTSYSVSYHKRRCPTPKQLQWSAQQLQWSAPFIPPQKIWTNLVFATSKPREVATATCMSADGWILTTRPIEHPSRRSSELFRLVGSHQTASEQMHSQTRKFWSNVKNSA